MEILYNRALLAAIVSWGIAQSIKIMINGIKYKKFVPERIFGAGGMPSSHSSTVCALAAVVFRICGGGSVEFALAFTLACIVMYDAAGVRRAAGMHAKELNKIREIVYDFEEDEKKSSRENQISNGDGSENPNQIMDIKMLKEYLGHTPIEVICGAVLGVSIGLLINL